MVLSAGELDSSSIFMQDFTASTIAGHGAALTSLSGVIAGGLMSVVTSPQVAK